MELFGRQNKEIDSKQPYRDKLFFPKNQMLLRFFKQYVSPHLEWMKVKRGKV